MCFLLVFYWVFFGFSGDIAAVLMAVSSAWGMLFVVVLMGHGMVHVPRSLWQSSYRAYALAKLEFSAPAQMQEMRDAECELQDTVAEIQAISNARPLQHREHVQELLQNCPADEDLCYLRPVNQQIDISSITLAYLEMLNFRLKEAINRLGRARLIWECTLSRSSRLHSILENRHSPDCKWVEAHQREEPQVIRVIQWIWYVKADVWLRRLLSIICWAMSGTIVWSELTTGFNVPSLSFIYRIAHSSAYPVEPLLFLLIAYISICTYSSLMRVRVFSYYMLVPRHSDAKSILFFASYLCRLTFPLGYNYLTLLEGHASCRTLKTEFSTVMGQMDLVPILGCNFTAYIPLLLTAVAVGSVYRWHNRLATWIGLGGLRFADGKGCEKFILDGRRLIQSQLAEPPRHRRGSEYQLMRANFGSDTNLPTRLSLITMQANASDSFLLDSV